MKTTKMSFFDQVIAKIFPSPEKIASGQMPVISQEIERSNKFMEKYQTWLYDGSKDQLIKNLNKEFKKSAKTGSDQITHLNATGARGFVLHSRGSLDSALESQFLLDYWHDTVSELNYSHYSSHSDSFIRDGKILVKERYYLKPESKSHSRQMNQEFGNILFELELLNNDLLYLKCMVTFYAGFNYQPPKNYHDLVTYLLSEK